MAKVAKEKGKPLPKPKDFFNGKTKGKAIDKQIKLDKERINYIVENLTPDVKIALMTIAPKRLATALAETRKKTTKVAAK